VNDWIRRNHDHYEERYGGLDTEHLIAQAGDLANLDRLIAGHTSWFGLYREGLRDRLKGKTVIEIGFGDGLNALFMARLGANVWAIEISEKAAVHLSSFAERFGLRLEALAGDFRELALPRADFIVGKALLHHFTHDVEEQFLGRCAEVLTPSGEARFFEPAVNVAWLDRLRWMTPVPGRPSSLRKAAFAKWKESDPHPERDNSSAHYAASGGKYFDDICILPMGGLERFRRLIREPARAQAFGRRALHWETRLPIWVQSRMARSQTIILRGPRCPATRRAASG
jgi:2-polyprenyl-3-methyl-5-hydroxy-6-metoxy-1,4-benzoquinol methylase